MFKFNVELSEQDYFEFNKFHMLKSPYGKKQLRSLRIIVALLCLLLPLSQLIEYGFALEGYVSIVLGAIILVGFQVFIPKFMIFSLKRNIKALKKAGKMAYSPSSLLEFLEDRFVETTESERTEKSYQTIERVSALADKTLYIHLTNISAVILPASIFESEEQYTAFLNFLGTKCSLIEEYK